MQVRTYQARSIKEALGKVRDNLGRDAMIMSTKKLTGDKQRDLFEVAAVPAGDTFDDAGGNPMGDLKSELMSIKEMIFLSNHSDGIIEKLAWNPSLFNLYSRLIRNGVSSDYAGLILKRSGAFIGNAESGKNTLKKGIKEIRQIIDVKNPFESENGKRVVAALVGTTGVGKTTTIAKLAAQLMLQGKKKVGLLSIDNYRIGAVEQIKAYSNILGIPCFPAFNRKDLLIALKKMEGKDVVLIDTAGQSQYDKSRIEELKRMMPDDLAISCHLLLSVATRAAEMRNTAANFAPLKFQSYIFTKADEAEQCGSIINQVMQHNLPISYITTGQNVPEDIEMAKKENILSLLLSKN